MTRRTNEGKVEFADQRCVCNTSATPAKLAATPSYLRPRVTGYTATLCGFIRETHQEAASAAFTWFAVRSFCLHTSISRAIVDSLCRSTTSRPPTDWEQPSFSSPARLICGPSQLPPIHSLCAGIYTRRTLSLDFGSGTSRGPSSGSATGRFDQVRPVGHRQRQRVRSAFSHRRKCGAPSTMLTCTVPSKARSSPAIFNLFSGLGPQFAYPRLPQRLLGTASSTSSTKTSSSSKYENSA